MSKKLIAVASAAALALSALVAVPASAMPFGTGAQTGNSVTVSDTGTRLTGGTGSISAPYTLKVPDDGTVTTLTTLRFEVSSDVKSRAFTVTSTSGIKLLDAVADATNKYTAASGAASLALTTNASGKAEFVAFPTTTTKGVITITLDGDITQIYMTGTEGQAYDLGAVTLPALDTKGVGALVVVVTDAFGNPIVSGTPTVTTTLVGTGSPSVTTAVAYSTTTKRFEGVITAGSSAGSLAVGISMATSESTARKAAFGDPQNTAFGIIQVAAPKTAAEWKLQVDGLAAQLAATVTKAQYNKLVKRWNKANPRKKLKLAN